MGGGGLIEYVRYLCKKEKTKEKTFLHVDFPFIQILKKN